MSLTITLPPGSEAALAERARARGQDAEQYATVVLRDAISASDEPFVQDLPEYDQLTPAERLAEFEAWMKEIESRPPLTHFVDDSRDSIYGGPDDRGER